MPSPTTGLIFLARGDGKVRAYDDDTGNILWTGDLPMGSRSIPVMYEAPDRQNLVVSATQPIAAGAASTGAPKRAYVAFALPE